MIRVKDLKAILDKFDDEYIVLMSKDPDGGNGFRHLDEVELLHMYQVDGKEVMREEAPIDFEDDVVVALWPGW